ncbi:lysophospholipase [Trametes punicea]|nr:lysophospholipase [Trametes punicea]
MTSPSSSSPPPAPAYTEAWLPGHDGLQFYTRTYAASSPARAVVLFVHGFTEHVGRYEWAHGLYAARGITVFAYDQRGFGRTALDGAHKSKQSAYGKTSWCDQFADVEWWVKRLKAEYAALPLFLMGHSMGGGVVLGFATRTVPPPAPETVKMLAGVIASSPLLLQTFPVLRVLRYVGKIASAIVPNLPYPASIPVEDLSHDPAVWEAVAKDPWIIHRGSAKGLHDMLEGGEKLLWDDYKHWPRSLSLLIAHGTADRVTSFAAAEEFFKKVDAADKEFKSFPDSLHELVNESDGVKEKYVDECISWILKHVGDEGAGGAPSSKL